MTKIAAAEKHHNRPKLGQHFLVDSAAGMRIVEALGDISERTVLEIGPGRGALTSLLAQRARRLMAIEIDRVLAAQLRMNFSQEPNVEIIEGDVLAIDFHTLFGPKPGSTRPGMTHQPEPARVVGNLPYFITSDILLRLFEFRQYFETIVLMVQREVGERMAAQVGDPAYGSVSVRVAYFARSTLAGRVPASVFIPRPRVESVLVRMERRSEVAVDPAEVAYPRLAAVVKAGFGQRRKMLRRSLAGVVEPEAFARAGVRPEARAEELTVEDWGRLAR